MDHATCNVLYVDCNVREDRCLDLPVGESVSDHLQFETENIAENARLLLDVFGHVHLISTGGACLSQWLDLQDTSVIEMKPTLILIDTPYRDDTPDGPPSRSPSGRSAPDLEDEEDGRNHEEELYGLALLKRIVSESYLRNLSNLVVPVPIVAFPPSDRPGAGQDGQDGRDASDEFANRNLQVASCRDRRASSRRMLRRCLDLGATDVMASPMNVKCITNLEVHAYRAHRDAARDRRALIDVRQGRKLSWVGITEEKPFAYLREAMVSGLMSRICRVDVAAEDHPIGGVKIVVPADRESAVAAAVAHWHFCAHDFSDDELIVAASVMFEHALSTPELEPWRIPTDRLHGFLISCRAAYNTFVPYHNFRHVVDVLQATFSFLVHIGSLPPFPAPTHRPQDAATRKRSPVSQLLEPFEALALLITAIGHDVGHPGVNNGFLTKLNAPLAQLYNDRSVLESFHCAAYSQILRRHWPAAFENARLRNLMISSILATDMGLHFDYISKMDALLGKLRQNDSIEGWNQATKNEYKSLACALLIKCADISNVARRHDTAVQWMYILSDEFSRQASMESELDIPTSLMAPPKKDMVSLGTAQLGFMNLFVVPLFRGVQELMPDMRYCLDELEANKALFEMAVAEAQKQESSGNGVPVSAGNISPRTIDPHAGHEHRGTLSPTPTMRDSCTTSTEREVTERGRSATPGDQAPCGSPFKTGYRVDGIITNFDAAPPDFAGSEPFRMGDCKGRRPDKQRCSETTEDSSVPCSGDWASGPTSATTSKLPLSPSTRGTSIVSRDSMDRPPVGVGVGVGIPVTTITAPDAPTTTAPEPTRMVQAEAGISGHGAPTTAAGDDGAPTSVYIPRPRPPLPQAPAADPALAAAIPDNGGKSLKKKPSRFRINALPFFKRHKSSSPSMPAADTAG